MRPSDKSSEHDLLGCPTEGCRVITFILNEGCCPVCRAPGVLIRTPTSAREGLGAGGNVRSIDPDAGPEEAR